MSRRVCAVLVLALALALAAPRIASAQAAPVASPAAPAASSESKLWLAAGGTWTTLRGDCADCSHEGNYRHSGGVLANIGYKLTSQMDVGAEVLWTPSTTESGANIRSTFVTGAVQFRPWASRGFFLKGGLGMAFVRNFVVDTTGTPVYTSKGLAVSYGAGWEFRRAQRVGFEVFGTQHTAALGNLESSATAQAENIMGNFWSLGAAIVIR